jgi:hypothetical protein
MFPYVLTIHPDQTHPDSPGFCVPKSQLCLPLLHPVSPAMSQAGLGGCLGHATPAWLIILKQLLLAGHWWLTPVILATWEAEIGRIMV